MGLLDSVKTSSDVKKLQIEQLPELCQEIRDRILSVVKNNGGHLSSNLGAVETTVAVHYVFDLPKDKLIFDVGHQCYTHKILSGRNEQFDGIRKDGGISGFPDREESEFDPFTTGHAGSSISAGLGYCVARDKLKQDYTVINFVGDGSLVNGLNLEALISSSNKPSNYIVILNDNGMSISLNDNGLYRFISKRTLGGSYLKSKKLVKKIFGASFISRGLRKVRNGIKNIFSRNNYAEQFGFKYVGIVDGNDVVETVKILRKIKRVALNKAVMLHIKTTKGKGYEQAEERADLYHGVGKDLNLSSSGFATAIGEKINSLMEKDDRVVVITAGMRDGTGTYLVAEKHSDKFYDVGIAEEYAVTLAGGMASGGLRPIVAIYSTFLQRAYDQILEDVCLQNLPVIFCIDRAGLVGDDGKTHQGVYDLSYLSHMPNMTVFCPVTIEEIDDAIDYAMSLNSPVAIRYPKNSLIKMDSPKFSDKLWHIAKEGEDITVLAVGPNMTNLALEFSKATTMSVRVVCARSVKPLDFRMLDRIQNSVIITLEENSTIGGFGSMVENYYSQKEVATKVVTLGVKDTFVKNGSYSTQFKENGLDVNRLLSIADKLTNETRK